MCPKLSFYYDVDKSENKIYSKRGRKSNIESREMNDVGQKEINSHLKGK